MRNTASFQPVTVARIHATWGIVSLRQIIDFTPGYIAERACRDELLDLAGMMTSPQ
jgi:hypothetical protein